MFLKKEKFSSKRVIYRKERIDKGGAALNKHLELKSSLATESLIHVCEFICKYIIQSLTRYEGNIRFVGPGDTNVAQA